MTRLLVRRLAVRRLARAVVPLASAATLLVGASFSALPATATTQPASLTFWAYENENFGNITHTATQDATLAKSFSYINALPSQFKGEVASMHAANPNLKILVYLQGVFAQANQGSTYPESWYAHDKYGNRVKNDWNLWMMNVGNATWASTVATSCANLLASTGFDGCFLDNLGSGTLYPPSLTGQPINPATGQAWTASQWLAATGSIAQTVMTKVSGHPVVGNGLVSGVSYFDATAPTKSLETTIHRAMAETFIRTSKQGVTTFRSVSAWKKDVDMVANAGASGNAIFLTTKVWVSATSAQLDQWHRYSLASALLGMNGPVVYTFRASKTADPMTPDSLAGRVAAIGSPSAAYSTYSTAYVRPFTKGKVVVNPGTSSVTVPLGGTYHTINGTAVTSVTLAPHTAEILTLG